MIVLLARVRAEPSPVPQRLTELDATTGLSVARANEFVCIVEAMTLDIYVGNLPYSASESEVERLFAQHGEVRRCNLPIDRDTDRPRGFGFVEMSDSDARTAIAALDGTELDGRDLRVNEAKPRGESGGGGYRGGGGGYSR